MIPFWTNHRISCYRNTITHMYIQTLVLCHTNCITLRQNTQFKCTLYINIAQRVSCLLRWLYMWLCMHKPTLYRILSFLTALNKDFKLIVVIFDRTFYSKVEEFCVLYLYNGKCELFLFVLKLYFCGIRWVYACMVTNIHVSNWQVEQALLVVWTSSFSIYLVTGTVHGVYTVMLYIWV